MVKKHSLISHIERFKVFKAVEFGYDSTWSEIEQILDGHNKLIPDPKKTSERPTMTQSLKHMQTLQFYRKVQKSYGIIGLLIIYNMMHDQDITKVMLSQGDDLKFSLLSQEEERIKFAFYLMMDNILFSVRALRQPPQSNDNEPDRAYQFWINRAHQKL